MRQRSVAFTRAPKADSLSLTTKIAASERYQFKSGHATPISIASSQKISSAVPGDGSSGDQAAPAMSMAPTIPTVAASMVAARSPFSNSSEARPLGWLTTGGSSGGARSPAARGAEVFEQGFEYDGTAQGGEHDPGHGQGQRQHHEPGGGARRAALEDADQSLHHQRGLPGAQQKHLPRRHR